MNKILLIFFLLISHIFLAQEYVFGKVLSEQNTEIKNVLIINIRTDEKTYSDSKGNFMILAKNDDELRFVKSKYKRVSHRIVPTNFKKPVFMILEGEEVLIQEVEIGFKPTGDIKKDSKALNKSNRTLALNEEMNIYMKKPLLEVKPVLRTPTAFENPSVNAVQVDVKKILGLLVRLIRGKKNPEFIPSPKQKENFQISLRKSLTDDYFFSMGLKSDEIDSFLKFADEKYQLTKKYSIDYNLSKLKIDLEHALGKYRHPKS